MASPQGGSAIAAPTPKQTLTLPRRQPQPHKQSAQILALFQCDIAAVNLRDVAHDREAKPRPRLAAVEPHPAVEDACPVGGRDAGAVVLDQYPGHIAVAPDRDEDAATADRKSNSPTSSQKC